jgi:hypothetical protein
VNGKSDISVNGHATETITAGEEQMVTGEKKSPSTARTPRASPERAR